jgi:hypothetical protein
MFSRPVVPGLVLAHLIPEHSPEGVGGAADGKTESGEWTPEVLDIHQNESVIALAERLVPGSNQRARESTH